MEKFTEDEKLIARNIDKKYKWIGRDSAGTLFVCERWWENIDGSFVMGGQIACVNAFNNLFKQIRHKQKPILIRDIYDPRILDDAERRYLEGVIRPWKTQVKTIRKSQFTHVITKERVECINITTRQDDLQYMFRLPNFKAGTMYEGMEPGREYTLKELGLFKGDAK